jgi:hypothetical protein
MLFFISIFIFLGKRTSKTNDERCVLIPGLASELTYEFKISALNEVCIYIWYFVYIFIYGMLFIYYIYIYGILCIYIWYFVYLYI